MSTRWFGEPAFAVERTKRTDTPVDQRIEA
jgi:hypothetical protein